MTLRQSIACLLLCLFAAFQFSPSFALLRGSATASGPRSELVLNDCSFEYYFVNQFKCSVNWGYANNNGKLKPDELTSNGYPIASGNWASQSGAINAFTAPSQAVHPGHQVLIAWGALAKIKLASSSSSSGVACTGTTGFSAGPTCDNTACSTFTGSISGTTLTVTAAPTGTGCTLGAGIPVTGSGVTTSTFGTPTIITSSGSACGGNTCYTVNQSQTVANTTLTMGFRIEVTSVDQGATNTAWTVELFPTTGTLSGIASFNLNEESAYWSSAAPCGGSQAKACILASFFRQRIGQANFKVIRDLNVLAGNISTCGVWAERKPTNYFGWDAATELRNAAAGSTTYVAGGHTYTIPIPGQYVNAGGTGLSGGTVSYNVGTDVYSITLGSGGPVDKQSIIMLAPATGTTGSKISLNGATAVPILAALGVSPAIDFGNFVPQSGGITTLKYDATLGGFLSFGGANQGDVGFNCGMPPEVSIELNAELSTTPWHVPGVMALDPMTDWVTQFATYEKANYTPPSLPIFEGTNEPWNASGGPYVCTYLSALSTVYIAQDANHAWVSGNFCGNSGNSNSEVAKIVSTMGQDLLAVYGAGNYELADPVQTGFIGAFAFNEVLQTTAYLGQSMAAQTGYSKIAAYAEATRISVTNYWHTGYYSIDQPSVYGLEGGLAYCFYFYSTSSACQGSYASQAAVMTAYMNSSTLNLTTVIENIWTVTFELNQWNTWASTCSQVSRPVGCTLNAATPLMPYEGGFQDSNITFDVFQSAASATNANPAVLAIAANGCVAGETVGLSSLSGGTWSSAAGSYTVQASGTDANHCAINLNSTGLGTLSSATLTYTGSTNYINNLRNQARLAPELDTLTTTMYNAVLSNGGFNPSQFQMASGGILEQGNPWQVFAFDIYGYYPVGQCSACTIASSTLTLGGTIIGAFRIGDTLFGAGVTGVGTGAGSNTTITSCTPIGANVCGTTSGDTLGLSQSSTVAGGTAMTGNAPPPANNAGNSTTSPVRAWGAICRFNGNGNQCNG